MNKKDFLIRILVVLLAVFVLNLILWIYNDIYKWSEALTIKRIDSSNLYKFSIISMLFIIFGALIEWERILNIYKHGFKINKYLFIIGIILAILSSVPSVYWIFRYGMYTPKSIIGIIVGPLFYEYTNNILDVVSGIIIVRSLFWCKETTE